MDDFIKRSLDLPVHELKGRKIKTAEELAALFFDFMRLQSGDDWQFIGCGNDGRHRYSYMGEVFTAAQMYVKRNNEEDEALERIIKAKAGLSAEEISRFHDHIKFNINSLRPSVFYNYIAQKCAADPEFEKQVVADLMERNK